VHVLSLAMLFAQLGMVVHASSHLDADPHATQAQQQLCAQCASFAPMQNMVGNAPTVVLAVEACHDRALENTATTTVPHRAFSAFRSRAPPTFL
jgi:hypothetical protein